MSKCILQLYSAGKSEGKCLTLRSYVFWIIFFNESLFLTKLQHNFPNTQIEEGGALNRES